MSSKFVTLNIQDVTPDKPLPVSIYVYLDFRFITWRPAGDSIDRITYDRLEFKKVSNLFIEVHEVKTFKEWAVKCKKEVEQKAAANPEVKKFKETREYLERKALDIFRSDHPDKVVKTTFVASKKLVTEVMANPWTVKSLASLQTFSRGTVDHSVNVSILASYLAMQMGYSHQLILQHISVGSLLHDIGKTRIKINDDDTLSEAEAKLSLHAQVGLELIEKHPAIANEVKMIIVQHHECFDGSGYPNGLRRNEIYDLTKIVSLANTFDRLVGNGKGALVERQKAALKTMDEELYKQFDPQKLEKVLKILRLGI